MGFVARVLTSAGVHCTHEQVFMWPRPKAEFAREQYSLRERNPDWGWKAESSWLAVPFLGADWLDVTVVHLVRHPENVIRSHQRIRNWTANNANYRAGQAWMYKNVPGLEAIDQGTDKSAFFYLEWNKHIEPYADVFHRIEDDPRMLLDKLGIDYTGRELFADTTYNHFARGAADFRLEDLPPGLLWPILEMAGRYGY